MKKWKQKIWLLLCAAVLLCACNAKEKTYETAYDYLTDHIADAAVLPDGTFAVFSELKEPNADAISKMTLPFTLGKYSEIQKFGGHLYLIDAGENEVLDAEARALYIFDNNQWVKLFDKSMIPDAYKDEIGIDLHICGEANGSVYFELVRRATILSPPAAPLYRVVLETQKLLPVTEAEKSKLQFENQVVFDGSHVEKTFAKEQLTAKQFNKLHELNNQIEEQIIFPPENEQAENKMVSCAITLREEDVKVLLCPLANNENSVSFFETHDKNLFVAIVFGSTEDNSKCYYDLLVYDKEQDAFTMLLSCEKGYGEGGFITGISENIFIAASKNELWFIDLTKV